MIKITNNFADDLYKKLKAKASEIANDKSKTLFHAMQVIAKEWKIDAVRKLSRRRAAGQRINNTRYPFEISGNLKRSLHYRTRSYKRTKGITIVVTYGFNQVFDNNGHDYVEILDKKGPPKYYGGFKQRIYTPLEKAIRKVLRRK